MYVCPPPSVCSVGDRLRSAQVLRCAVCDAGGADNVPTCFQLGDSFGGHLVGIAVVVLVVMRPGAANRDIVVTHVGYLRGLLGL